MSAVTSMLINGFNTPVQITETTSSTIFNAYRDAAQVIKNTLYTTSGGVQPLTTATATTLQNALNVLRLISLGVTSPLDPNNPTGPSKTYYLTYDMALNMQLLFHTMQAMGVPIPTNPAEAINWDLPFDLGTIQPWASLVVASSLLQGLFNVGAEGNRNLQAMVELDYVRTGNDVLATQLSAMEDALKTTKTVLDNLGNLQELHNNIVVDNAGSFTALTQFKWNPVFTGATGSGDPGNAQAYEAVYRQAASSYYGQVISPRFAVPAGSNYIITDPAMRWMFEHGYTATLYLGTPTRANTGYVYGARTVVTTIEIPLEERQAFGLRRVTPGDDLRGPNSVDPIESPPATYAYVIDGFPDGDPNSQFQVNRAKFENTWLAVNHIVSGANGIYSYGPQTDGTYRVGVPATPIPALGPDPLQSEIMHILSAVPSGAVNYMNELLRIKSVLTTQVQNLLTANGTNPIDPNSLLGRLQKVLADINTSFVTSTNQPVTAQTTLLSAYAGLSRWMLDSYNTRTATTPGGASLNTNTAGAYQQNITFAITAGQSSNDTQTESVRRFLYVFEEYYKSASAILQQMTQILQRIAQGISR